MKSSSRKTYEKRDVYQEITDHILAALESGNLPWWSPDWKSSLSTSPFNGVSGHSYRSINQLTLNVVAHRLSGESYDPRFLTFNQAKTKGWNVKKGEKGYTVVFYKKFEPKESNESMEEKKSRYFLTSFTVFHASQIEGCSPYVTPKITWDANKQVEAMLKGMKDQGLTLQNGGDRAYYSPERDHIQMPHRGDFETSESYYSTLLHEMGHATGHSNRLNRELTGSDDDSKMSNYAQEELIAEIASSMMSSLLGVNYDPLRNSAYIAHWFNILKEDKKAIAFASGRAAAISDYLIGLVPGLDLQIKKTRLISLQENDPDAIELDDQAMENAVNSLVTLDRFDPVVIENSDQTEFDVSETVIPKQKRTTHQPGMGF